MVIIRFETVVKDITEEDAKELLIRLKNEGVIEVTEEHVTEGEIDFVEFDFDSRRYHARHRSREGFDEDGELMMILPWYEEGQKQRDRFAYSVEELIEELQNLISLRDGIGDVTEKEVISRPREK